MNILKNLQTMSFRTTAIIFIIGSAAAFLAVYATCGTLAKVDCHEVILGR